MTLGRTSTGAIKIKTDGDAGLRAVNCACCAWSGCFCGWAKPINPPSDPDFTKKLFGTDPSVTPFTQVTLAWGFSSENWSSGGDADPVAYNPVVCSWPNKVTMYNGQKRIFPANTVSGGAICGQYDDYGNFAGCESYIVGCEGGITEECLEGKVPADFFFYIDEDSGCMNISVYDAYTDNSFWAYTKGAEHPLNEYGFFCDTDDDPRISITVNGQHYPAIVQDAGSPPEGWFFAMLTSGFVDINFS